LNTLLVNILGYLEAKHFLHASCFDNAKTNTTEEDHQWFITALSGEIRLTTEGQKADSSNLIDASSVDLSKLVDMGEECQAGIDSEEARARESLR